MGLKRPVDVFLKGDAIALHAEQCRQAFDAHVAVAKTADCEFPFLTSRKRFIKWAANAHVFWAANASLEYHLRHEPVVVKRLHQLLDVILDGLASCKSYSSQARKG